MSNHDWWSNNKKSVLGVAAGVVSFFAAFDAFKPVDSGHFGVHTRLGKVLNDTVAPGVKWKIPLIDRVHQFQNNTIILETKAGTGRNTQEQNMLSAEMRLHYTIDPNEGVLALHIGTMSDDNGEDLLEELMDQSFNAVVGERHSSDHMADPEALLRALAENLEWRLSQNNVPISLDAAELLVATIGDGQNPYRTPIQLRIRRVDSEGNLGWAVEEMAGPAALPIQSAGQTINPNDKAKNIDTLKVQ